LGRTLQHERLQLQDFEFGTAITASDEFVADSAGGGDDIRFAFGTQGSLGHDFFLINAYQDRK